MRRACQKCTRDVPARCGYRRQQILFAGISSKPSDGLEPSTPSLPCAAKRLPWVATGCGSACLSRFRAPRICHRLPPVALARLHKCSIHSLGLAMAKGSGVPTYRLDEFWTGSRRRRRREDRAAVTWRARDQGRHVESVDHLHRLDRLVAHPDRRRDRSDEHDGGVRPRHECAPHPYPSYALTRMRHSTPIQTVTVVGAFARWQAC